jgi:hypothetical protein
VAALAEAYQAALKNAQAVVAFKLQIVGGAQTNAATLLASVTQQVRARERASTVLQSGSAVSRGANLLQSHALRMRLRA